MTDNIPQNLRATFNKLWEQEDAVLQQIVFHGRDCFGDLYHMYAYDVLKNQEGYDKEAAELKIHKAALDQAISVAECMQQACETSDIAEVRAFAEGKHTKLQPLFDAVARIRDEKITDPVKELNILKNAVAPQDLFWMTL